MCYLFIYLFIFLFRIFLLLIKNLKHESLKTYHVRSKNRIVAKSRCLNMLPTYLLLQIRILPDVVLYCIKSGFHHLFLFEKNISVFKDSIIFVSFHIYLLIYFNARTPHTWYLSCWFTCMAGLNISVLYGRAPLTNTFFSIPKYPYFAHGFSQAQWTSFRAISLLTFFAPAF